MRRIRQVTARYPKGVDASILHHARTTVMHFMQPNAGTSAGPTASLHKFKYARGCDLGLSLGGSKNSGLLCFALVYSIKCESSALPCEKARQAPSIDGQADTRGYE